MNLTDTGEPVELQDLPAEVRQLVHAVDRMRDGWADGDDARRRELWQGVHEANDSVWGRVDQAPATGAMLRYGRLSEILGERTALPPSMPDDVLAQLAALGVDVDAINAQVTG